MVSKTLRHNDRFAKTAAGRFAWCADTEVFWATPRRNPKTISLDPSFTEFARSHF